VFCGHNNTHITTNCKCLLYELFLYTQSQSQFFFLYRAGLAGFVCLVQPTDMSNIIQQLQGGLLLIQQLRVDTTAKREDILDDLEQRMVHMMHRIVATPTVDNFVLPINSFDQNDVFLNHGVSVDSQP
jgi:hypothetical protein